MSTVHGTDTAGIFCEIISALGFDLITTDVALDSIFDNYKLSSNVRW